MANPLRLISLFQDFSDEHLGLLQRLFTVEKLEAKATIYSEGSKATDFYILYAGRVVKTVVDDLNMIVELTKLNNLGSLFGDEALLLEDSVYDGTMTTLVESVVFKLPRRNVDKFLHISGELGSEMRRAAYEKVLVKGVTEKVPAFASLSKQKQHLLGALCQLIRFSEGEVVSKQGKVPKFRAFYVISSGTADVILDGKVIRTIGPGNYFGEIGIVTNRPHSATVKAVTALTTVVLEREDFRALFVDEPSAMAEFAIRVYGDNIEFHTFIPHKKGRESFMAFCKSEFAEENVEFLIRVERLEEIAKRKMRKEVLEALNVDADAMRKMKQSLIDSQCKKIIESFVKDDCTRQQISMSGETKEKLLDRYTKNDFSGDMFDDAKELVSNILEKDNFARYKKSESFKDLLKSVGMYF